MLTQNEFGQIKLETKACTLYTSIRSKQTLINLLNLVKKKNEHEIRDHKYGLTWHNGDSVYISIASRFLYYSSFMESTANKIELFRMVIHVFLTLFWFLVFQFSLGSIGFTFFKFCFIQFSWINKWLLFCSGKGTITCQSECVFILYALTCSKSVAKIQLSSQADIHFP